MDSGAKILGCLGLFLFSLVGAGCGSCGKEKASAEVEPVIEADVAEVETTETKEEEASSYIAAAFLVEGRAHLWANGASAALSVNSEKVRWAETGFHVEEMGGIRFVGPGSMRFWRSVSTDESAKPLSDYLEQQTPTPDGFSVSTSTVGNPGKELTRVMVTKGEKVVRIGMFKAPLSKVIWFQGEIGKKINAAPKLTKKIGWKKTEPWLVAMEPPEGGQIVTSSTSSTENLAQWQSDLGQLRGGELEVVHSQTVELDGDDGVENLVCVAGGTGDHTCYMVDQVGDESRYYSVNIDYRKGDQAPLAFRYNGHSYLMWVGRLVRSRKPDAKVLQAVRFDGRGFATDLVR